MALAAGTRIGPYEIAALLGVGGMGEVYRARDTRLAREVAIKVLPTSFAGDADRLRRFEQEARATGLLNHPNILQVHDVGSHEGAPYVVSELLEGETLRDRIGGTPLPVRKAIDFATQIARGLSAAHEKGIVHRDLKPENLFLTRDGRVKILDFGLAKLVHGEALSEAETNTHGMPGTDAGKVLGTVGYMSPEQVRAQPVDHRSDIFSFGSVLYEMLSGRRAFRGASAVETMSAILKEDPPDLSETNRSLPPALERIVSHCLEKNPEERFQSARDIAFDLEQLSGSATTHAAIARGTDSRLPGLRVAALGLAAFALAAAAFVAGRRSSTHLLPEFRPVTFQRGFVAASRFAADGQTVVYAAEWPGTRRNLYTAQPGSPESRSLDLEDAALVGVSRSGELAVLLARGPGPGRTLARLPMGGGAPRDVAERVVRAAWGPDATSFAVVRVEGGRNRLEFPIGKPLYEAVYLDNVRVSPRGDLVAFTDHPLAGDNRGDVAVVDLAGRKRTLSSGWSDIRGLVWSPDGKEVWFTATRMGIELNLWAVTPDGRQRQVYRAPGSMQIQDSLPDGRVLLVVGRARPRLVGRAPGEAQDRDLSWLDWGSAVELSADGKTFLFGEEGEGAGLEYSAYIRGTNGSPPVLLGKGAAFSISPDGRRVLVVSLTPPAHLVLLPTGAGDPRPLPRGSVAQFHWGSFFPDGKRIAFTGNEEGKGPRLFVQDLAGGDPKPVSPEGVATFAGNNVSPDGAFLAAASDAGLALYHTAGGEPRPVKGAAPEDAPLRFSGDGRFLYVRGEGRLTAKVFRLDLASGTRELWKELAPAGASSSGRIWALTIAPDVGAHAYTFSEAMTTLYEVRGLQ